MSPAQGTKEPTAATQGTDAKPRWHLKGDWFDVCSCNVPCPCYFAQPPTGGDCEGVLAWHIREGKYGDVALDGLNVLGVSYFEGNIWSGDVKFDLGLYVDARADERQRKALETIFTGQAGGWMGELGKLVGNLRGIEAAPIEFEVAGDLASWRARIPGKVEARAEALAGPTTPPGKRVQVHNAAGSEVGPGQVATQGIAVMDKVDGFGFQWERSGRSSKHFPFDWNGPDGA